jgi:hypothetical protein
MRVSKLRVEDDTGDIADIVDQRWNDIDVDATGMVD